MTRNHRSGGNAENGAGNFGIPSPRQPLDDSIDDDINDAIERPPEIGTDDPTWWYDQSRKRGNDRRYWGQVERIGGVESDQLRQNLAAAIRDLLNWAN